MSAQVVKHLLECVYLTPGDHEIKSRLIDHCEESNATGPLLDILNGSQFASTLPVFDPNAYQHDGISIFPGAMRMGRLFSYAVRSIGLKILTVDGSVVPIDPSTVSYEALEDVKYMDDLSLALTRTGPSGAAIWTLEAEAYHVSRGVEAFFRGCLSINADGAAALYFMGRISNHVDLLRGCSPESTAIFLEHCNIFRYHVIAQTPCSAQPIMINKTNDEQSKEVKLGYVRCHLWELKAYFDNHINSSRKRPREAEMPPAVAPDADALEAERGRLEAERDRQRVLQRIRSQAATTSMAQHTAIQSTSDGVSKFELYSDGPLNDAMYDRYIVEQTRLANRIKSLQLYTTFVHDTTPIGTENNKFHINQRDESGDLTVQHPSSIRLLEKYQIMKTIPIYIDTGLSARRPLEDSTLEQHRTNMTLLSRVFREVRRVTTLTYLLSDGQEDLKIANKRISSKESFLTFLNSGRENNSFLFNFDDAESNEHLSLEDDAAFTLDHAKELTKHLNVVPPNTKLTDKGRVNRTLIRVPKLWSIGMQNPEDTARVVAQYSYASAHEIGVRFSGAYVFHRRAMFDDKLFRQWNLLYSEPSPDLDEFDKQKLVNLRQHISTLPKTRATTEWLDELRDTTLIAKPLTTVDPAVDPAAVDPAAVDPAAVDPAAVDILLTHSRRHWKINDDTMPIEATDIYQLVQKFRRWRRSHVLHRNNVLNSKFPSRAEKLAKLESEDRLDLNWFADTFGCSPDVYNQRTVACGAKRAAILIPKTMPASLNSKTNKVWGVLLLNEKMRIEFGDDGNTPVGSVMEIAKKALLAGGKPTVAAAKEQFTATRSYMDAMWKLLAKMSSVGVLNVDVHLGNYMIVDYPRDDQKYAKIIDFDASFTTVLTKADFQGDDPTIVNTEGWKPLYVLNVLMVLYTLAQDTTRTVLYNLLKNALRVDQTDSYINDAPYVLKTERQMQFKEVVLETMRALEQTAPQNMSLPQRLLAATWRGGFKGMGNPYDLQLPTAFFSSDKIQGTLFQLAEWENNKLTLSGPKLEDAERKISNFKSIILANNDAGVEELKADDVTKAVEILQRLDADATTSNRPAPKIPASGATHLSQMEWATRHNIFSRSFMDLNKFVAQQWALRQGVIDFTIERGAIDTSDTTRRLMRADELTSLIGQMSPLSIREFNALNGMFDNLYRTMIAPATFHTVTPRDERYRIVDFLYEYVFSPTRERPLGEGKTRADLTPRFPHTQDVIDNENLSTWQTWRRHIPENGRDILSLPPTI